MDELRRRVVLWWTVLAAAYLVLMAPTAAFAKSESTEPSRAIAIAYDNSGSMTVSNTDRWCNAKYSLEVLASMLNEDDTLGVYLMSRNDDPLIINGSNDAQTRVKTVHNWMFSRARSTPAWTVDNALKSLESSSAQKRYLVVTTDGKWNALIDGTGDKTGKATEQVDELMQRAADEGIHVIYLAMGEDAESTNTPNVSFHKASTDDILQEMTSIANEIFGRAKLPANGGKVNFEVPMSKLIVFAQGENVEIGNLNVGGREVVPSVATVRYSDEPYATQADNEYKGDSWKVNKKLRGMVAVYSADMPIGSYQLDVKGADGGLEVYYTPNVDIAVKLTETETGAECVLTPNQTAQIDAGEYRVTFTICDADGNELDSSFFEDIGYVMAVDNNGSLIEVGQGDTVAVEPGTVTFSPEGTASLSGSDDKVTIYSEYEMKVGPKPQYLDVDVSGVDDEISITNLSGGSGTIRVSKKNGEAFTAEEREKLSLSWSCEQGLEWEEPVKTDEGDDYTVVFKTSTTPGADGEKAARKRILKGKLFGFLTGGTCETNFTARIPSDTYPYAGNGMATTRVKPDMRVVIAWWLFIAALLALIISYIRKPRLPKLKPRLVYSGTTVPLKYNGKVGHRFLLPWSAETASFKTVPSVGAANMFAGCFTPMTIGVKAVRGRGRRFKLDDRTVQMLGRLEENPSGYPPKFSCIELSPEGKGKRKATSNTVFTATDSIRFYGKNPRANTKQKFIIKFS